MGRGGVAHLAPGKDSPYYVAMIKSRLTTKSQTTIPRPVRNALRLKEGDELSYRIDGSQVILTKASQPPSEDPFVVFEEWDSEADRTAYASL